MRCEVRPCQDQRLYYMGKYLTSLLILTTSLLLPHEIFADEQVRRVQEELRKRHLFYANPDGVKGAALAIAVKRYQQKKGFSPTGIIDSVTLVSLGIPPAVSSAASTPIAIGKRGEVHGANGERLPSYPPFLWPNEERVSKFDPAIIDREYVDLANFDRRGRQRRRALDKRVRLTSPEFEPAAPFATAFDLRSERIRHATASPVWPSLVLQPPTEGLVELVAIDDEPVLQATGRSGRRTQRRSRRVKPRKETNPFVLTYQSVDRALRSLFGDTQSKKKRSMSKRL